MVSRLRTLPFRSWVGLIFALGSLAGLVFAIQGDLPNKYLERSIMLRVAMECDDSVTQDRKHFTTKIIAGEDSKITLHVSLFDRIKEFSSRRSMLQRCTSTKYFLNFVPEAIVNAPHEIAEIERTPISCRPSEKYCFRLGGDSFQKSKGSIVIKTGRNTGKFTISTRIIEFVISSIEPDVSVYVETRLPSETIPVTLVPPPKHMISGAGTRLYYEGSEQFGGKRRTPDGRSFAISQAVGAKITYQDPKVGKIEDILIIVISAIFGIAVALLFEGWFKIRDKGASNKPSDGRPHQAFPPPEGVQRDAMSVTDQPREP